MPYELSWFANEKVLRLDMQNGISQDELMSINQAVMDILDATDHNLIILIDVSALTAGYSTVDYLRNTQAYRDHRKLDSMVVIADNKLNKLVSLLAFSMSRANFTLVDSMAQAQQLIIHH